MERLQGRNVAVFGGSSGIGAATVRMAHARGARVLAVGRDRAALDALAAECDTIATTIADVTNPRAVEAALAARGSWDHVLVTLGTVAMTPIRTSSEAALRQPFEERVFGTMNVVRAGLPRLAAGGGFVFVTGDLVDRPVAGLSAVGAAATAVEALAAAWVLEEPGARFNVISPASIDTPLQDKLFGDQREAGLAAQAAVLPGKRAGTAEEVAHAILSLAVNPYVNGAVLAVDGGKRHV